MGLLHTVIRHFDLTSAHVPRLLARSAAATGDTPAAPGSVTPTVALLHYVCLVLGVLAKFFLQFTHGDGTFDWLTLASSLIISAVVYPFVFRKTTDQSQNGVMRYFVCFQNGFFFQTLLEEIQNTLV